MNNITAEDRRNFDRSNFLYMQNTTKEGDGECTQLVITESFYKAQKIAEIESLVHDIANTEGELFYIVKNEYVKYIACKEDSILNRMIIYINYYSCWLFSNMVSIFPIHRFNHYFEVFGRNLETSIVSRIDLKRCYLSKFDKCPSETDKILQEMADDLNDFIEHIRSEVQSEKFKAEISYCLALINNHHLTVTDCIDTLFSQQPQLLVLRMDIGYKKCFCDCYDNDQALDYYSFVTDEVINFFCSMEQDKSLFEHLLGYVWKLDFSSQKGFYHHLFLFFDGSKEQDDINLSKKIGDFWVDDNLMTDDDDHLYYSYNRNSVKTSCEHSRKNCGIGMINKDDIKSVKELKKEIRYITMLDYFVRINAPYIERTYGHWLKDHEMVKEQIKEIGNPT
jgi:hypothetical protein